MKEQLDGGNALPLYEQIAEIIRDDIIRGRLAAGERVESEAALGERYGVSRLTARRAVSLLARQGLLVRAQGRGTFVAQEIPHTAKTFINFMRSAEAQGAKPSTEVLAAEWRSPEEADARLFSLEPGEKVLFLRRLRLADGRPVQFEEDCFAPRYGYLLEEDITGSIFDILRRRESILPAHNVASLEMHALDSREAAFLRMEPGEAVASLQETVYDQYLRAIYRSRQLLGPHFRFSINA